MDTESGWTEVGDEQANLRSKNYYAPKLFLDNFAQGLSRTYAYELLDEAPYQAADQGLFGLATGQYQPKQALTSLTTAINLLTDSTPCSLTPGSLAYSVNQFAVHSLLIQKCDGSFWLGLWQDARLYREAAGPNGEPSGDMFPPALATTVSLPVAKAVTQYKLAAGTTPVATLGSGTSFTLPVPSDDVVFLKVTG
jgi:hypothetical protein